MRQRHHEEKCDGLSAVGAEAYRSISRQSHRKSLRRHNIHVLGQGFSGWLATLHVSEKETPVLSSLSQRIVPLRRFRGYSGIGRQPACLAEQLEPGIHRFTNFTANTTDTSQDAQ